MSILRLTKIQLKKDNNMDIEEIRKVFKNMGLSSEKDRESIIYI